jgi:hypothetical protein
VNIFSPSGWFPAPEQHKDLACLYQQDDEAAAYCA